MQHKRDPTDAKNSPVEAACYWCRGHSKKRRHSSGEDHCIMWRGPLHHALQSGHCYPTGRAPEQTSTADSMSPSPHFKASGCLKASNASAPRGRLPTIQQVVGNAEGRGNPDTHIWPVTNRKEKRSPHRCVQRTVAGDGVGILS